MGNRSYGFFQQEILTGNLPVTLFMIEDSLVSVGESGVELPALDVSTDVVASATELPTLMVVRSRAELVEASTDDIS